MRTPAEIIEMSDDDELVDDLLAFVETLGGSRYDDAVTQLAHALQAASLAQTEGQDEAGVTAALLHDLGHLLIDERRDADRFLLEDRYHESVGAAFLSYRFPPEVTEPIRLHVQAKRYLCSVDRDYHAALSEASQRSFELQGAAFGPEERCRFEQNPFFGAAVALRRIDDRAKVRGRPVPRILEFRDPVKACLAA